MTKQSIQVTVNFKDGTERQLPPRTITTDDWAWETIIGEMLEEAGIVDQDGADKTGVAGENGLPWSSLVVTIVNDVP